MIQLLDKSTIDKIAAGEVIERPSSVVKELLENSIDAGATSITTEIKEGGIKFIRVTDNGFGIDESDVRLAVTAHATSKIKNADDIRCISSLGFRGEALSTISAVSYTELVTKTAEATFGTKLVVEGGEELEFGSVGVPNGTTIIVKDLFYNTPARKKFLKTAQTEGSYIGELVLHLALSHPNVAFKFISNGKLVLATNGNGKVSDVIYELFGKEVAKNIIPIDYVEGDIKISGFIGKPLISRGNRGLENYFVNGRYIKLTAINRGIEEGYRTFVMQHRFPFTALYFELPLDKCDVNVHPTKMEFKYADEPDLYMAVEHCVREALHNSELIIKDTDAELNKATAKLGNAIKSNVKPAEPYEVNRTKQDNHVGFEARVTEDTIKVLDGKSSEQQASSNTANTYTKPVETTSKVVHTSDIANKDKSIDESKVTSTVASNPKVNAYSNNYSALNALIEEAREEGNVALDITKSTENVIYSKSNEDNESVENNVVDTKSAANETFKKPTEGKQLNLFKDNFLTDEGRKKHRLIGQVFGTYWLIEYEKNLYIIDQHAAHEKVNYEKFLAEFESKKIYTQQIAPAIVVRVTYTEKQAILNYYDLFMQMGYDLEEFGENQFKINGVPSNLYGLTDKYLFMELVNSLMENSGFVSNKIFVQKLATMACKAAIKGNTAISFQEADHLIDQLLKLNDPYTCPHGRPTIVAISEKELEKKFKRIV